jgi:site-specific recombinase XerD
LTLLIKSVKSAHAISPEAIIFFKVFSRRLALTCMSHRLKGSDSHPYPLFPSTKRLLTHYLARPRGPWTRNLLPSRQRIGQPISASLVAHLFRKYARKAGIPAGRQNVHALRHSIAMHMGEGELDGVDMQDWMGHVSWASTRI